MRYLRPVPYFLPLVLLCSCVKPAQEVAEEIGLAPSGCGSDGARVQVDLDGSSFCADAQITAIADGLSAMITGIGLLGSTFTIQLDTLGVGVHTISEVANAIVFAQTGTPYITVGDSSGVVTIDQHDASTGRLKAHFQARVVNEMSGTSKPISGSVDVTCLQAD